MSCFASCHGTLLPVRGCLSLQPSWMQKPPAAYLLVALSGSTAPGVSLTAALVSIVMLLLSGSCILSSAFYKMLLFTLHNRAWRKLLSQTRAKTAR